MKNGGIMKYGTIEKVKSGRKGDFRKKDVWIAMTLIAVAAVMVGGCIEKSQPKEDITLDNFPKLFEKDVIIVVGENASSIELDAAKAVSYYLGDISLTRTDAKITGEEKTGYNLILVGRPDTNKMLREVYERTNATEVTSESPGVSKGVLEILKNPWNESKVMLLVEGSDEWGVRAGSVVLEEKQKIKDKAKVVVDWEEVTGVMFPIDSPEEAIRYADTDIRAKEFIKKESSRVGTSARFLNPTNDPFPKFLNITDNWWIVRYASLSGVEKVMTIYVNLNGTIIYGGVAT